MKRRHLTPVPSPLPEGEFADRLKSFRDRPKQPTDIQSANAERERAGMMNQMQLNLTMLRLKMAAIGGTEWTAARVEAEAIEARKAANKFPN